MPLKKHHLVRGTVPVSKIASLGTLAEDGFVLETNEAREAFFAHVILWQRLTDIYVLFVGPADARSSSDRNES
jgi:hypothetical protein